MWYFLVSSHGVFVSISNGDNSIKTLLLIVCNFRAVERGCREGIKKLDNRNQVKIQKNINDFSWFLLHAENP